MNRWIPLVSRRVRRVLGSEAVQFLQGVSTNDMRLLAKGGGIFTAFVNRQGRFLADAFVFICSSHVYIEYDEIHETVIEGLFAQYGALHKITTQIMPWVVFSFSGPEVCALAGIVRQHAMLASKPMFQDLRHPNLGFRAVVSYENWQEIPHPTCAPSSEDCYRRLCIQNGIPNGALDLVQERAFILEYDYHEHHSISWNKGCYIGQEVIARSFHQKRFRRSLFRVQDITKQALPRVGEEIVGMDGVTRGYWGHIFENNSLVTLDRTWAQQCMDEGGILRCTYKEGKVVEGRIEYASSVSLQQESRG